MYGDLDETGWMASADQVDDFFVAIVYRQSGNSLPSGALLQTPGESLQVDQPARSIAPVNWLFHNPIVRKQE
jgi:hypothetical protein